MTLAEIRRQVESIKRVQRIQAKERAVYDYILANMIGISNNRNHSEKFRMPAIEEFYPTIFEEEAQKKEMEKQQHNNDVSTARLIQFAQAHNAKLQEKGVAE